MRPKTLRVAFFEIFPHSGYVPETDTWLGCDVEVAWLLKDWVGAENMEFTPYENSLILLDKVGFELINCAFTES